MDGLSFVDDTKQGLQPSLLYYEMQRQQQNVAQSAKEKGKKPSHRIPAMILLSNHWQSLEMKRRMSNTNDLFHQTLITKEYPPSYRSFDELRVVQLNDLLVETVHEDAYIVLRTISEPLRRTAISTVIEDCTGTIDLLSLYNINIGLDDNVFLPHGSYLAIRAPYYKLSANGNYTLRTDHPSDVVKVSATHPLVTQFRWEHRRGTILEEDEPSALKEEGNLLYRKGHYQAAMVKYTTSMESPTVVEGSELWRSLHCNRALARLRIFQFDGAVHDCNQVIQLLPGYSKALIIKGRALYHLRRYDEAHLLFQHFLTLDASSAEGKEHMLLASKRMEESATGVFDFAGMRKMAQLQKYPRLEYGCYIGPVELRRCNPRSKGRGLFATRDIDQGELVMCEKAFAIAYEGETGICATINTVKNRLYMGPDSCLPARVVQLLSDNPSMADQYLNLYSGGRVRPGQDKVFTDEGALILDSFTVAAILDYNAFKPENAADLIDVAINSKEGAETDAGLWIQASYLNHSCTGNIFRAFIGDFAILRALRPIKSGEELHHPYVPPLNKLSAREEVLRKFDVICSCELCLLQRGIPQKELRLRMKAVQIFRDYGGQMRAQTATLRLSMISRARSLIKNIRKTYPTPKFCHALLEPYAMLSALEYSTGRKTECMADLTKVITLVSGADATKLEKFEPLIWTPELMHLLLTLCVVVQEVGSKVEASICKEASKRLYGIVSGLGYDAVSIDDVIQKHKMTMGVSF